MAVTVGARVGRRPYAPHTLTDPRVAGRKVQTLQELDDSANLNVSGSRVRARVWGLPP